MCKLRQSGILSQDAGRNLHLYLNETRPQVLFTHFAGKYHQPGFCIIGEMGKNGLIFDLTRKVIS